MDTIETYREQLKLGLAAFQAAHPHPFLIMRKSGEELRKGMPRMATMWAPMAPMTSPPPPPSEESDLLFFEVRPRPGSFFPRLVSIGRGEQCDVSIPDDRISRLHASIECSPSTKDYWLFDADSRNGTKLNGRNVAKGERVKLSFGDTIKLGTLWLEFASAEMVFRRLEAAVR
ncbi:MAG: FHA domain-containing protein [Myxococcales bacterium]|jgi:hypothetical protein